MDEETRNMKDISTVMKERASLGYGEKSVVSLRFRKYDSLGSFLSPRCNIRGPSLTETFMQTEKANQDAI